MRTVGSTKIDVGQQHFEISNAALDVDSNNTVAIEAENKSTHGPRDDILFNELKRVNLEILYDKFHQAGINYDIVWALNDEMLQESGLTKIEQLRYQSAKAKEYGIEMMYNGHLLNV